MDVRYDATSDTYRVSDPALELLRWLRRGWREELDTVDLDVEVDDQ